ncbi:hypothetical protein B7755_043585 [Streptomyces sp. NBS 14/10]|uniref:BadF/BadG/BcrA/BcrD ATPase family protein n=1 Tax=Streptomyces sp. NBS 14/10 TaxID=1945643 RepID=UPI000B7E1D02|nr:BadF/BadG/BcrA/BcrD ATPase family protein [Streptomyces sp. NBS 14/10]KAK1184384.1 hypothetical protein B7755_043585 [Streptomyces sp. NBS 14/10]
MTPSGTAHFVVEAGGSTTRVSLRTASDNRFHRNWASVNPASVGHETATSRWAEILSWVAEHGTNATGWIASASVAPGLVEQVVATLKLASTHTGLEATLVLSNDILPLLLAPPVAGRGIALIAGTGSGCVARDGRDTVHIGGYEYVLSDDGSGYWIGLRGLRAASRAMDGIGPATQLVRQAVEFGGCEIPSLGRRLAQSGEVKNQVAAFANRVIATAAAEDAVSAAITSESIERLVAMVSAAHQRLDGAPAPLAVVGSLAHESAYFRRQLLSRLSACCPDLTPIVMPDGLGCTWQLLEDHIEQLSAVTAIDVHDEVLRVVSIAPSIDATARHTAEVGTSTIGESL